MDQSNTFNLDNEINQWFGEKRTNPSFTASDRKELKSHLYEIIDALTEKGLDESYFFWNVVCDMGVNGFRLGDGGEIKAQMLIRIPNAQFSTSAPLLPNRY